MEEEFKVQGFDITVTHRDPQSGVVIRQDPYNLIVSGDNHQRLWERPKNSGNVFDKQGRPIGRWIRNPKGKDEYKPLEDHVAVAPVLSNEDQAKNALHARDSKIAELERKLIEYEQKQTTSVKQVKPKAALKADEV